jgi:hypothetical protein
MEAGERAKRAMTDEEVLDAARRAAQEMDAETAGHPTVRFLIPFVALMLSGGMVVVLVPELRVALGHGVPGTFTAQRFHCTGSDRQRDCEWLGDFVAADGRTPRRDVSITGIADGALRKGARVDAIDVGSSHDVYPREARYDWIGPVIGLLVALAMLLISATGWRSWWRARRLR